jgi:hypothetical protein
MTQRGLIGAVLYAMDLDRLVEFYASVAGIEPQAMEKGFAILGSRPSQFVILRIPRRIADAINIATPQNCAKIHLSSSYSALRTSHMPESVRQR